MFEIISFTVLLFAFFLYAIFFLKHDFIMVSQYRIKERLFLKRVYLVKNMCISSVTIEQLNSVDRYFNEYVLKPYIGDELKSDIIDELQLLITNRLKSLNLTYSN